VLLAGENELHWNISGPGMREMKSIGNIFCVPDRMGKKFAFETLVYLTREERNALEN
jgi:hypothetical protein